MMMKCISKDEGSQLLQDINSGVCGRTRHDIP
jgi:hypothetical protein